MTRKREKNWWEDRLATIVEQLFSEEHVVRGLELVQEKKVLDFMIGTEKASARVEAEKTYRSEVAFIPYSDAEWDAIITRMAHESLFFAALLSGKFPAEIEEITAELAHPIMPSATELRLYCDCRQKHCPHLAGLLSRLNDRLNADPSILFILRGRGREEVLTGIRNRRHSKQVATVGETPQLTPVAETTFDKFWGSSINEIQLDLKADDLPSAILKRVNPVLDLTDLAETQLEEAYATVARRAQAWGLSMK